MRVLLQKLRSNELSLEQTIFFFTAIAGIMISLVAAVTNIPLGLHVITVIIPVTNILLNAACIVYSVKTAKWFMPSLLVVLYAILVLFPSLWFSTGGATGSTLPYLIMSSFFAVILFRGKLRNFLLIVVAVLFSFFILLELYYPNMVTPYISRAAHYTDLIIGFLVSFTVTALLAILVFSQYRIARQESEELVKKLAELSNTDSLTGIYNRRMLASTLDEEMQKSNENGLPLTICIIDIDDFKHVNDVYGHLCGDEVLIELAAQLSKHMGENDILGRYGGEEFLVVFKNQTMQDALVTVECFHKAIQSLWMEGQGCQITISCGVSAYTSGMSYPELLNAADTCLYEAKNTGRNKIVYK